MQKKSIYLSKFQVNNFNYLKLSLAKLDQGWQDFLLSNCYDELMAIDTKLIEIAKNEIIYPPQNQIFNALKLTSLTNTKVVIIGQDPYHGEGEAMGVAFAVNSGIKLPPSLKNIYKEVALEYNISMDVDGTHLINWAKQGVLLLNASLTVIKDRANSLATIGWHEITDKIIRHISENNFGVVFMLWGAYAQQKAQLIDECKHKILFAPHPSPLSAHRGFFGCNHFRLANEYIQSLGKPTIDWIKL
ncbi:MAG: uracil-DNA glycosylase [Burkholderiales bacterium]|jgi:uracil-DNA glycosylase|nr:uracil-DNA glycosylase [Burkholderiales bacterium]